jgi:hypothetical protein
MLEYGKKNIHGWWGITKLINTNKLIITGER